MTMKNDARTVLVTGGSRGIGAAVASACARRGHVVAVNATHDSAALQAVVSGIRDAGGHALALAADVTDEAQVLAMFARLDAEVPPLSGLVNNAGIVDQSMRLDQMSVARWQRMFNVNVIASLLCAREAVLRMSTRHGGRGGAIVNVSSAASRIGSPAQYVDYAASKGAIDTFTLGLAREVAAEGIRVNAVRPGIIDTQIHALGGDPDRAARLGPELPMHRAGRADEVAAAVVWLLDDAASYTTGALLDVAGGR